MKIKTNVKAGGAGVPVPTPGHTGCVKTGGVCPPLGGQGGPQTLS